MSETQLIWVDLETTGLDPDKDEVLEISVQMGALDPRKLVRDLGTTVFAFPGWRGDYLPTTVRAMHARSKLLEECAVSEAIPDYVDLVLSFPLDEANPHRYVLAGTSVHFDHGFIKRHFPNFARRLSYRHYDVRAIQMFAEGLGMPPPPKGEVAHRAEADVHDAIARARYVVAWLQERGFNPPC